MSERESFIDDLSWELVYLEQEAREKGRSPGEKLINEKLINDIKKKVKGFNEDDKQFFKKNLLRHYAES